MSNVAFDYSPGLAIGMVVVWESSSRSENDHREGENADRKCQPKSLQGGRHDLAKAGAAKECLLTSASTASSMHPSPWRLASSPYFLLKARCAQECRSASEVSQCVVCCRYGQMPATPSASLFPLSSSNSKKQRIPMERHLN